MKNPLSSGITRTVGKRTELELCFYASGNALKKAASFNESLQSAFPYGRMICCRKGVYHFKTHEEANLHQEEYIANTMARIAELNKIKNGKD